MSTLPPDRSEENSKSPHEHRYYRYSTPLAAAALIVAIASAVFAWRQSALIDEGNNLIRRNNVISQRAFIFLDTPEMRIVKDKNGILSTSVGPGLTNAGNTATKKLEFYVRCAPSINEVPEPWVLLFPDNKIERTSQIIGAHQTSRTYCNFTIDHLKQVRDGKAHAYVLGDISYRDRLNEEDRHRTQFVLEIIDVNIFETPAGTEGPIQVSMGFQPRGAHNCADDDCPKD